MDTGQTKQLTIVLSSPTYQFYRHHPEQCQLRCDGVQLPASVERNQTRQLGDTRGAHQNQILCISFCKAAEQKRTVGCLLRTKLLYWIALSVLNCSSQRSSKDHLLLVQCYYRRKPKLN